MVAVSYRDYYQVLGVDKTADAKAIKQAGKNSRALSAWVRRTAPTALESSSQEAAPPSAVGSAFDLGSGPTALLLALAGTAVLLLAASGVRGWRRSHRA